jgi:hypothetical protein
MIPIVDEGYVLKMLVNCTPQSRQLLSESESPSWTSLEMLDLQFIRSHLKSSTPAHRQLRGHGRQLNVLAFAAIDHRHPAASTPGQ